MNGCTFYQNSATYSGSRGGAIAAWPTNTATPEVIFTGNLFFGNTATNGTDVWINSASSSSGGTFASGGYNVYGGTVVDGNSEAPITLFSSTTNDLSISVPPIQASSFKLLSGGGAQGVMTTRPAGYPTTDFYGDPTPAANAASGAVQSEFVSSNYGLSYGAARPAAAVR